MRSLLAVLGILAIVMPAMAEIKTEEIEYRHGDTVLQGFLAYDDAAGEKRPGVLIVHEWWGHNDYVRSRAEQLAKLGYVAFALDMYGKGVRTDDPEAAGKLARPFYQDTALTRERASAGLKILADHARVDRTKLAAIGYCFGGKVALELARSGADLAAVVSFHGSLGTAEPAGEGAVKATVLVCHGADDPFIPAAEKAAFLDEMKKAKADLIFVEYAGAVHAFTNPAADGIKLPGAKYDETADRRSWRHMRDLLEEKFGSVR